MDDVDAATQYYAKEIKDDPNKIKSVPPMVLRLMKQKGMLKGQGSGKRGSSAIGDLDESESEPSAGRASGKTPRSVVGSIKGRGKGRGKGKIDLQAPLIGIDDVEIGWSRVATMLSMLDVKITELMSEKATAMGLMHKPDKKTQAGVTKAMSKLQAQHGMNKIKQYLTLGLTYSQDLEQSRNQSKPFYVSNSKGTAESLEDCFCKP